MIGALKPVEAGRVVEDVARKLGVSKHTLYAWKTKYGGMDVSRVTSSTASRRRPFPHEYCSAPRSELQGQSAAQELCKWRHLLAGSGERGHEARTAHLFLCEFDSGAQVAEF